MREIRGEMTTAIPSFIRAGSWKQSDFPPPVASIVSVSLPARIDEIVSSCKGRNEVYPQYFFKISSIGWRLLLCKISLSQTISYVPPSLEKKQEDAAGLNAAIEFPK
jgi:hypothetical protein